MYSMRVTYHVNAPRGAVYRALLDADAVAVWRVPNGMRGQVHEFEPHEGGSFRVSLTYEAPDRSGKTTANTDTYHGRFVKLVPDEQVVEQLQFESSDPALSAPMTISTTLSDANGGTDVVIEHTGIPDAIAPTDNENGTRMALTNLARLVESQSSSDDV
jgi:uncharacterized protein YndB with AHSA1/START domain